MKEKNDIDKLLKGSLDTFRPTPGSSGKEKFLEEAAGILPGNRRPGSWWKPASIAIIIVALTGSLTWYFSSTSNTGIEMNDLPSPEIDKTVASKNDITTYNSTEIRKSSVSTVTPALKNELPPSFSLKENDLKSEKSTGIKENLNSTFTAVGTTIASEPVTPGVIRQTAGESEPVTVLATANEPLKNAPSNVSVDPDTVSQIQEPSIITPPAEQKTDISQADSSASPTPVDQSGPGGGLAMYSMFYLPRFLFNTDQPGKMINSFGAEFQFRPFHPKYVIRAGAGISFSPGQYDYGIDYNEYLGSYLHLDSVTFNLAPDNFHLESTYYQSERSVYDSSLQTQYMTTDKRFAYLYVPVMLGYDLVRKDHFTFGFRAGPAVSVLLNRKASTPEYDPGLNQVVQVNMLSPLRTTVVWEISGGLNFTFISNDNYFIELEPAFSWYLRQLNGESGKKDYPYSVGIRVGVGIIPKKAQMK